MAKMQEVYGFTVDPADLPGRYTDVTVDHLFGTIWTDETLDLRDRRMLTIGVLAAQDKPELLEIQFENALRPRRADRRAGPRGRGPPDALRRLADLHRRQRCRRDDHPAPPGGRRRRGRLAACRHRSSSRRRRPASASSPSTGPRSATPSIRPCTTRSPPRCAPPTATSRSGRRPHRPGHRLHLRPGPGRNGGHRHRHRRRGSRPGLHGAARMPHRPLGAVARRRQRRGRRPRLHPAPPLQPGPRRRRGPPARPLRRARRAPGGRQQPPVPRRYGLAAGRAGPA